MQSRVGLWLAHWGRVEFELTSTSLYVRLPAAFRLCIVAAALAVKRSIADPLPVDRWIEYDIALRTDGGDVWLSEEMPNLTYPGEARMRFVIKTGIDDLLFGFCRKPHHNSGDGFVLVDELLGQVRGPRANTTAQPALLLMTGDQVYLDDVAGPMLAAIYQVIEHLGLPPEGLSGAAAGDSAILYHHPDSYF